MSKGQEFHCGPDGSSKGIRRILTKPVPGVNFNSSCSIHDNRYGTPGYSKSKADLEFLGNNIKHNWWNPIGWVLGIVEYIGVAIGGRSAYEEAQTIAFDELKKKESEGIPTV